MKELAIAEGKDTPHIYFDMRHNILAIKGRSYPENTSDFYSPLFSWLNDYLSDEKNAILFVNIDLYYFNSSSSKVLLDICDIIEDAAGNGKDITLNWIYEEDNEDSMEFGQMLQEDYHSLKFYLVAKTI